MLASTINNDAEKQSINLFQIENYTFPPEKENILILFVSSTISL
jgi:hypothetical protein